MAKRIVFIVLFSVSLLLMQCKSNQAQVNKEYQSLITKKFGKEFTEQKSPNETYSLVQSKDSLQARKEFSYSVIRLKDNEIVLEGKYNRGGYAKWLTDTQLEVLAIPRSVTVVPDTSVYVRQILLE